MRTISLSAALCALIPCLASCTRADSSAPAPAPAPAPAMAPAPATDDATSVTGKVLETMDSGGYTYVRLAAPSGERWAAVNQTKVAVGDTVTIGSAMVMRDFESKTLNRTFPEILFGVLEGAPVAGSPAPTASPSAQAGKGKIALAAPIAKADGPTGRTIAEVFAGRATLAGQPVAIRAQVTKYNADILGKNWLHLQDGSGDAGQGDFDLTVTTAGHAAVGDIVLVRGVVRLDRDFGAGYAYPVLIEDATVEKP